MNRVVAWLVLAVCLLGACGIPLDDEPEILTVDELPAGLQQTTTTTTTTIQQGIAEDVTIFYVRQINDELFLEPVVRQVPAVENADLAATALEQVFLRPTAEERETDLITLTAGSGEDPIQVIETRRPADGRLVVVLSELPSIEGSDRITAFAQMVFTVTNFESVDAVRFQIINEAGEPEFVTISTDEGDVNAFVGPADFASLTPAQGPDR